jgi:transposase InsO family protein
VLASIQQAGVASTVESGQHTSIRYTERLAEAGAKASIGSVGDSHDAMAESIIGQFKTEVIRCQGPWHNRDAVEMATLEGRLVQQPPPLLGPGRHPTGRGRIGLLRHHDAVREPSNGEQTLH